MIVDFRYGLVIGVAFLLGLAALLWWIIESSHVEYEPAPPLVEEVEGKVVNETIGSSVEGRDIEVYRFGDGSTELLFVGGIHGGYEWNSVVLAYEVIDELMANPQLIPEDLTVSIIPSLNPDGVYSVVVKEGRFTSAEALASNSEALGRFNANEVDLNRNFDCKWQPESTWRGNIVSAGTSPFSEPEALALRDYVIKTKPKMVVFWHSQASAVYASECLEGVLPETAALMNIYAEASGYQAIGTFDAYPVTGDAEGWLASVGIPAITVELSTHESIEWTKNWAAVQVLLSSYSAISDSL